MAKARPLIHTLSKSGFCIHPPGARANAVRMYFKRAALGCGSTVAHAINCVRPLCGRRSGTISGYFWASCAGHAAHRAQAQGNHPLGRSSCAKEARPTAEQPIARPAADMCEQTRRLSAGGDELSPRPSRPPSLGLAAQRGMRVYAGGSILARLSQAKLPLRRKCSRMESWAVPPNGRSLQV